MEAVYLRMASTGKLANRDPVMLRRIPIKGEIIIAANRRAFVVIRVVHDWDDANQAVVVCDLAPAEAVLAQHNNASGPEIEM